LGTSPVGAVSRETSQRVTEVLQDASPPDLINRPGSTDKRTIRTLSMGLRRKEAFVNSLLLTIDNW